jgi:hypothetical protein
MARSGSFSAPSFQLGAPISFVKPPDNVIPLYDPALVKLSATPAQKDDLQAEVDELAASLTLARDYEGLA